MRPCFLPLLPSCVLTGGAIPGHFLYPVIAVPLALGVAVWGLGRGPVRSGGQTSGLVEVS